jgi:hypothetical protein
MELLDGFFFVHTHRFNGVYLKTCGFFPRVPQRFSSCDIQTHYALPNGFFSRRIHYSLTIFLAKRPNSEFFIFLVSWKRRISVPGQAEKRNCFSLLNCSGVDPTKDGTLSWPGRQAHRKEGKQE